MNCLLCNRRIATKLTIRDLLWPGQLSLPVVCAECRQKFIPLDNTACCPVCARPQRTQQICADCLFWREHYPWQLTHRALYSYNAAMKEFMHRYKFSGDYRLRAAFAPEFTIAVRKMRAEIIVPIPVTRTTMQSRGFNQVTGLLNGLTLLPSLQNQAAQKTAQSQKSRQERLRTPQPFQLNNGQFLVGKRVLLVDDVYTTGRTIYHAAELVYRAGAAEVISISLAR